MDNMDNNQNYQNKGNNQKSNAGLIVALSVSGVLVVAMFMIAFLFLSGIITIGERNQTVQTSTSEETIMYVANVEHSIYFRSAPAEVQSNIITEILYGTPVTYLEQTDAVFAKIRYNGQEGYVKREYLATVPPAGKAVPASGDMTVKYNMYVYNVAHSIYLRSEPNESGDNIICEIPLGAEVGFIEKTNGTFTKIRYGNYVGYSKSIYLTDDYYYTNDSYMTVSGVEHSVYLRISPDDAIDGNVICEIPVGSTVEFLSAATGDYYMVKWNGNIGYVTSKYLR